MKMNTPQVMKVLIAIALVIGLTPIAQAQTYVLTDLDVPGGNVTNAWGINDANHVVGWYEDATFERHGFIYDRGYTTLNVPDATLTSAQGINNGGIIVGFSVGMSGQVGFIYDGNTYTTLTAPGAFFTSAHDINDAGTIVGAFGDDTGNHGFIYDGNTYTTLDYPGALFTIAYGINNAGTVVGYYEDGITGHAFIYDGSYTSLDAATISGRNVSSMAAYGINDAGIIVGSYLDISFVTYGFLYDGETFTAIETGGAYTEVTGINNHDDLSGWYSDSSGNHGFLGSAQTFGDVPPDYWAFSFIEALARSGITAGCGNGNYCPTTSVTRAQMAVFLERGMRGSDYSPPSPTGNVFADVAASYWAAAFIEQFFLDGITSGCGNMNYCPDGEVTRDQMAVFLLRAKHGSGYSPPPATGVFNDVPLSHWAVHWIEQLAAEGITAGCGGGNYCPDAPVNRDQMAVFLVRAFGL